MTAPSPEGRERLKDTLFVTDAELIRRLGLPEPKARRIIQHAEKNYGFPAKRKVWGDRRYWPAVKAWLDEENGLNLDAPQPKRERRHG